MPVSPIQTRRLAGYQDYATIQGRMQAFTDSRDANTADELWILEHSPVYSMGLNADPEHLLDTGTIPVVRSDRGGQVTYHGPGQLVVYTMIDLARCGLGVREYVQMLEGAVIDLLADFGIRGERRSGAPGVYVDGAKITALGLKVRRGRCYHGVSLNVDMDLAPFGRINPCGFAGMPVCQLSDFVAGVEVESVGTLLSTTLARTLETCR
ncbi:MAG: lipoyl(octanoyl) transferase LipB [Halothiobacillaceae bacterium]